MRHGESGCAALDCELGSASCVLLESGFVIWLDESLALDVRD